SPLLYSHGDLLIQRTLIKLHPYDNVQPELRKYSNLIVLPHKIIQEFNLQLYHLLYHADALITDYSSVFCDYLLLDRPIAFNVDDIDDYRNNRGFIFENPLDYMPGYIVKNESDLDVFLNNISEGIDISKETRHKLFNVYNTYKDGNNSKRLLNQIGFEL
ncbi:CDP-glycerol glycerophosphotransferase family protein, partial [Dysgonomonas sp.]|uniref:CDP-glycerol glycerophosphotransferase family protein n=1 Tax=Dysgonomonas sp. TaxID=1891233 RepID=UPI0027B96806